MMLINAVLTEVFHEGILISRGLPMDMERVVGAAFPKL